MLDVLIVVALAVADGGVAANVDAGPADNALAPPVVDAVEVRHVTVAVAGSAPFVTDGALPGETSGMSLAVWAEVAEALSLEYEIVRFDSVAAAIDAVAAGNANVAVGPISITSERATKVDFTQPYFQARVGILTEARSGSAWDRMKPLVVRIFLYGLGSLILILSVVGAVVWLAERKANAEQFPSQPVAGIGNGMWFALVTMTTVGYGDRAPVTRLGRIVTSMWMLIGVVAMSSITAGMATALTLSQIDEDALDDLRSLRDHRVAVVRGTPGVLLARRFGAKAVVVDDKAKAIEMMKARNVDAMIYDLPVLNYYLENDPAPGLVVYGTNETADHYGFALPRGSKLKGEVDVTLLQLLESEQMSAIRHQWLSD